MSKKPRPQLPASGGSYTTDKAGVPVLESRTLQVDDPAHGKPAATGAAADKPVKEA